MEKNLTGKKILFIHHGRVLGGAPVSLLNTIIGLEQLGCDRIKILLVYDSIKPFFEKNCNAQIGNIYNPCLYLGRILIGWSNITLKKSFLLIREVLLLPYSIFKQYKTFKIENPDIIHLNSSILFSSAVAAKLANFKLVWHVREILIETRLPFKKKIAGWLIRKLADKVITISYAEAVSLGENKHRNVEVVYNFIDFKKFDHSKYNQIEVRKKLGLNTDDKIVLCISNLSQRKGTLEIAQSLKYLNDGIKIVMVGVGEDELIEKGSSLKKKIKKILQIFKIRNNYKEKILENLTETDREKIVFAGFQEDVVSFIASCDLLIAPWTSPHFARPIFEAWSMKKPVVAFDVAGIIENVEQGRNGVLVSDKTGKGLAKAINDNIFKDEKLKTMGEAGYKKAYEQFRQEINVKNIYNIYKGLIG